MHVTLTGCSPALESRLLTLLAPVASCRLVGPEQAHEGTPSCVIVLGDALSADERRATGRRIRRAPYLTPPLIVVVVDDHDTLDALAAEQLVDVVMASTDSDARIRTQIDMLCGLMSRLAASANDQHRFARAVTDSATVLLWMADEDGQCVFANAAYSRFAGVAPDVLLGSGWKQFIHPEDLPAVEAPFIEAPSVREEHEQIYRYRRADGLWRWILDRSVPYFRRDGSFAGFVGSCTDITDIRQAERDVKTARDLAIDFAKAASIDEVLPACLEAAREVSGYTHGVIFLRSDAGDLRPTVSHKVSDALAESMRALAVDRAGERRTDESDVLFADAMQCEAFASHGIRGLAMLTLRHQDHVVGLLALASSTCPAIPVERRGPIEAIAALMSTALARMTVEEALTRSERLLRTVVREAPIAIWTMRRDGTVGEVWNPATERLFGYAHSYVASRPLDLWIPEHASMTGEAGTADEALQNIARVFNGESLRDLTIHVRRPDGVLVEVLVYATPIVDTHGVVAAAVLIGVDISERRQFEAQLVEAQKHESLGTLAGGLAHDFNNLLTGIVGYLDLARADLGSTRTDVQELLECAEESARRATQVTRQMLAYSGGGKFFVTTVDLSGLVSQTLPLLSAALRRATLVTDLADDVPPVDADMGQLRQVLINLVTNAVESLEDHGGTVTVRVCREQLTARLGSTARDEDDVPPGDYAVLTIADTGTGMDARTRARAFDPFFTTRFVGRGLGLPAVLGIVRGHHGYLRLDTEAGRGTTVRVYLPVAAGEDQPMTMPLDPVAHAARRRVLVVDDEPGVLYVASQALSRAEYDVLTAASGRDAIELIRERDDIGLVILDLTMPEIDGRQTLLEVRRLRPAQRVVLTSGYSEQEALRQFGDGSLAGFLQKPFGPRALLDAVTRAIGLPEAT